MVLDCSTWSGMPGSGQMIAGMPTLRARLWMVVVGLTPMMVTVILGFQKAEAGSAVQNGQGHQ